MKINKKSILVSLVAVGLLTGCGPKFQKINDLDLKKTKYETISADKDVSFGIANPVFIINSKLSQNINNAISTRLEYNASNIACHLTSELNNLVISKGISVSNNFKGRDQMTFTQKRETSALFYPEITIDMLESSITQYEAQLPRFTNGAIIIKAKVDIVMLEPLSGEKIWIKSIPVKSYSVSVNYEGLLQRSPNPTIVEDKVFQTAIAIDKLLIDIDSEIINSANKYIDIEEFRFLNDDIKKLKNIKRY